jgi:hypothetical protein
MAEWWDAPADYTTPQYDQWARGNQPYRQVDDLYKPYYTQNPATAIRQFAGSMPGGAQGAFGRYVQQNAGQIDADFTRYSESHPQAQLIDFLNPNLRAHLNQQFRLQSSDAQGQRWGPNAWAGKWMG